MRFMDAHCMIRVFPVCILHKGCLKKIGKLFDALRRALNLYNLLIFFNIFQAKIFTQHAMLGKNFSLKYVSYFSQKIGFSCKFSTLKGQISFSFRVDLFRREAKTFLQSCLS